MSIQENFTPNSNLVYFALKLVQLGHRTRLAHRNPEFIVICEKYTFQVKIDCIKLVYFEF